ncbi:MAG: lytic murein transglycosylase [Xanthobacteraceae bacterium]|uniref:lytic murein transglycosylase n=1 Tax=Pseudolabrys sp. TaxID=1960880 RepID=UPI003D14CA7F
MLRTAILALALLTIAPAAGAQTRTAPAKPDANFQRFVLDLWPDAKAKGITRANFDLAMRGVTPDERVIKATKRQPEYGKPVGAYVNDIVSANRVAEGKRKATQWEKTFDAVEKKYGVERWVLLSIWGMESSFGAAKDRWDVFRSLASLAYVKYRHPYFRNELFVAMKLMQDGSIPRPKMVSSWAGAMGQTQFMPSNVVDYAVTSDGKGIPDLWNDVPDILASTANYLAKWKWNRDMPWGFEVFVPKGFDYRKSRATFAQWTTLGVKRADGKPFPAEGNGILFFPSGAEGPGFIVTKNFDVLKEYNNSDAYAIAVGHLADRIHGGEPIKAAWPKNDPQLPRDTRVALQKKLASLGYKVNEFDAHIDFDLRDNIRDEQVKFGMVPDGHPTAELLAKLGIPVR